MSDLKYRNSIHYETVDLLLNSAPGDFIPQKDSLDTLCFRNAGFLQNQHPAHVWHQRIAALNVISIHSNQIPERGRRATVFVPAHLCVPAPSASTQNRYPKYITCKKTDNNYEVLLPPFLLADFFKNNRRPAVSVPCGAERRGNHITKLKGS